MKKENSFNIIGDSSFLVTSFIAFTCIINKNHKIRNKNLLL